ncbi:MAG: Uma2 family endonuclease [Candidatus Tectomicrobia bacterium]|uniref:Uma2 family endonuclease n=1 Tax=Tectimicrobiota bacterium TaxID=2528274 RepID=A0A937W5D9_UNCTE|nr:Uma2 family endonuclease [Candidatus Tectomicrobia bacterium]
MAIATQDSTHHLLLTGVQWGTYEALLTDVGDRPSPRLAYDHGVLEIMVPSFSHEQLNRLVATLVEALAMGMQRDFINAGSTTFKRADLARGFEPDSCFYFEHVEAIRGQATIDVALDPPPDLVIEIDITHPSLDKLPLYAAIGVLEVWRADGQQVVIYRLETGTATVTDTSMVLPGVTAAHVQVFLTLSTTMPRHAWFAAIQAHVQA